MIFIKTELIEINRILVKMQKQLTSYQYNAFVIPEVREFLKMMGNTCDDIQERIDTMLERI